MKDRFYLACTRDSVGSNMAFHGIKSGYPSDVRLARTYTRSEAQAAWDSGRSIDLPISADHVDALLVWKVDMQLISDNPSSGPYLAYAKNLYDGNDVFFYTKNGTLSTNVDLAVTFESIASNMFESYKFISVAEVQAIKRPTFDFAKLNRKTMIQGAGIKTPKHIKKELKRKGSSLFRFNCPGCGKFLWLVHPDSFHSCNDPMCPEYRVVFNAMRLP